jgi:hypothetical protein
MTVPPVTFGIISKRFHFHSWSILSESVWNLIKFLFVCSAGGKILLSNLPLHVRFEDLEPLLTPFGSVQNCEKLNSRDGSTQTVQVSYETQEQAQQWVYMILEEEFHWRMNWKFVIQILIGRLHDSKILSFHDDWIQWTIARILTPCLHVWSPKKTWLNFEGEHIHILNSRLRVRVWWLATLSMQTEELP